MKSTRRVRYLLTALTWLAALGLPLWAASSAHALLPEDEAFPFAVERVGDDRLVARWETAEDYYLYRHRIELELIDGDNEITNIALPRGEDLHDEFFGDVEVYYGTLQAYVDTRAPIGEYATLRASFQGCNAPKGVCYPPMTVEVRVDGGEATRTAGGPGGGGPPAGGAASGGGGDTRLAGLLGGGSAAAILGGFFLAGLLLAFTACLYPMIPILSGLIVGAGRGGGRPGTGRALWLSFVYVQAMAVTYAAAGALAGLSGRAIQADLQGPLAAGAFAALFVVLAGAMFGFYSIQMPAALQSRLQNASAGLPGGQTAGVAGMGVASTLIVGACSGPALVAALAFIGNTGDAALGAAALYAMALGMGAPLLVVGTAAGRWMPGSGPWMTAVKQLFGFVFLGVALWMASRFLPAWLELGAWGALLLIAAIWLLRKLPGGRAAAPRAAAGTLAALVAVVGIAQIGGAATGATDPLRPWTGITGDPYAEARARVLAEWEGVSGLNGLEKALEQARAEGRPAVVDVTAEWCVYCVQLEERTLPDDRVRAALDEAVKLRVDVTGMSPADRKLLEQLNVFLPPAVLFFDAEGRERDERRVVGFMDAERFAEHARAAFE